MRGSTLAEIWTGNTTKSSATLWLTGGIWTDSLCSLRSDRPLVIWDAIWSFGTRDSLNNSALITDCRLLDFRGSRGAGSADGLVKCLLQ